MLFVNEGVDRPTTTHGCGWRGGATPRRAECMVVGGRESRMCGGRYIGKAKPDVATRWRRDDEAVEKERQQCSTQHRGPESRLRICFFGGSRSFWLMALYFVFALRALAALARSQVKMSLCTYARAVPPSSPNKNASPPSTHTHTLTQQERPGSSLLFLLFLTSQGPYPAP